MIRNVSIVASQEKVRKKKTKKNWGVQSRLTHHPIETGISTVQKIVEFTAAGSNRRLGCRIRNLFPSRLAEKAAVGCQGVGCCDVMRIGEKGA